MKILGLIPARSGSKGIKNKNLTLLKGKPLIYYTFKTIKKLGKNIYPFVSTDSKKIIKYCNKFRVNSYLRPKFLSQDKSDIIDVLIWIYLFNMSSSSFDILNNKDINVFYFLTSSIW